MPLIIISGYPTSGKTHRAQQLYDYLTQRISSLPPSSPSSTLRTHLISDHTLCIPRAVYNLDSHSSHERSNNSAEKDARATIYAAVKRVLSKKDIVILDSGNYIKGWRYQLYCEAKALGTGHCVLYVGAGIEPARAKNEARLKREESGEEQAEIKEEDKPYTRECWENLVFRYEEPNGMTRWDSPLFAVIEEDAEPPGDKIWDVLVEGGGKKIRPNAATVARAQSSEGYLYELDRVTKGVVERIAEWGRENPGEGGEVMVGEGEKDRGLVVEVPAGGVGLPALQRWRRAFIGLNRMSAVGIERIRESFVGYLNDAFAGE